MYRDDRLRVAENRFCAVCASSAYLDDNEPGGDTLIVCGICGKYRFNFSSLSYLTGLRNSEDKRLYRLSHNLRRTAERAKGKRDNSYFPKYSPDDFEKMLDSPDPSIQDKLQTLLKYLATCSEYPGQTAEFDYARDYSVLCAKNPEEARFYLLALRDQGLLSLEDETLSSMNLYFVLSARAWTELERLSQSGGESSNAFIAMWFDSTRAPIEVAINSAVRRAGYIPIRIDRIEHLNRIDDEIIARIRQSKFLIADFTGQRNGVYFEAGFMLGLGRPVIWLCEKVELDKVHFDTRQYNTIDYIDAEDLEKRLRVRIEANLGQSPHFKTTV